LYAAGGGGVQCRCPVKSGGQVVVAAVARESGRWA